MSTAIAHAAPPKLLTYEAYMAEEVSNLRCDIVESVRFYRMGETIPSLTFSDLTVAVEAIFAV